MATEPLLKVEGGDPIPLSKIQGQEITFRQSAPIEDDRDVPVILNPDGSEYSLHSQLSSGPLKLYDASVCVGYAHTGMVYERFMASMLMMQAAHKGRLAAIGQSSCNLPMNRNNIMHEFLTSKEAWDWLLFLDTDIRFPPFTAAVLTKVAIETGADICAAPYMLTNGCSTFGVERENGGYHTQGRFKYDRAYEIAAAGTGCMLISRKLMERMKEVYAGRSPWEFCGYDRIEMDGKFDYESDDYSLCHRAKDIGAKIVGYTGIVLSHLKTHPLVFGGLEDLAKEML